jgi:hypothetical protein
MRHSYVIQHDMGRNWSLYMVELYRSLFEEFELKKVDFNVNDNTLSEVILISDFSANSVFLLHP